MFHNTMEKVGPYITTDIGVKFCLYNDSDKLQSLCSQYTGRRACTIWLHIETEM